MIAESIERAAHKNLINRKEINIWVNASSLALGVLLERDGTMFEDACWLWPANDAQYTNLA